MQNTQNPREQEALDAIEAEVAQLGVYADVLEALCDRGIKSAQHLSNDSEDFAERKQATADLERSIDNT